MTVSCRPPLSARWVNRGSRAPSARSDAPTARSGALLGGRQRVARKASGCLSASLTAHPYKPRHRGRSRHSSRLLEHPLERRPATRTQNERSIDFLNPCGIVHGYTCLSAVGHQSRLGSSPRSVVQHARPFHWPSTWPSTIRTARLVQTTVESQRSNSTTEPSSIVRTPVCTVPAKDGIATWPPNSGSSTTAPLFDFDIDVTTKQIQQGHQLS